VSNRLSLLSRFLVLAFSVCVGSAQADNALRFAWLSDTHVGSATAEEDLRAAVRDINSMTDLSFVVVSGDVTEYGSRDQLLLAHSILAGLQVPSYTLPGNHDTKWSESGATDFGRIWGADRFCFERNGFVFIGMHQGPLMRMGDGHWAPQDVRWLKDTLAKVDRSKPLIFITHYPIDDGIANWYVVLDLLKEHNTQVVLCGHGHNNRKMDFEGIPGVMGRSNLRARAPAAGFNIVELDSTTKSMTFSLHLVGTNGLSPWHSLPIGTKVYTKQPGAYPRPDFTINQQYPAVREIWSYDADFTVASAPSVWKNLAIFGDASGTVTAVSLDSGKPEWRFRTRNAVYTTPAVNGDKVFVTSTEGRIYALNAGTGRKQWSTPLRRPVVASPLCAGDRVYFGTSEGSFYALNAANGDLAWRFDGVKGFVEALPLMHNGKIIFGAWDRHLYALDARDGILAWSWKSDKPGTLLSPAACTPVAANGKIFIASPDRFATAIDAVTGQTVWRTNQWMVRESIGISDDFQRIYAREMNDKIIALDAASTTPTATWETDAKFGYDINSAQIVEKDGAIYYGTKNGLLLCLDAKTGSIRWQHKIGVGLVNTLVPLKDGKVLAADFDGRLLLLSTHLPRHLSR
jgi:Icc-related predicted phosphoesterase